MVDIRIGAAIPPAGNHPDKQGTPDRQAPRKKNIKERRKNREDRRKGNRNGIIVTLSTDPDRRRTADRRQTVQD